MYLALDLGTTLGWATFDEARRLLDSGTINLSKGARRPYWERFCAFKAFLDKASQWPLGHVFYEKVMRHKGTQAAHVYGGLEAFLLAHFGPKGVLVTGLPVGVVKKAATGKGNASKGQMVEGVNTLYSLGLNLKQHDEADAIAVGHAGGGLLQAV